jgi:hypothetical protein
LFRIVPQYSHSLPETKRKFHYLCIFCYRICACISRIFLTRIYTPKLWCGLYTELKTRSSEKKSLSY